jgi:hypothetical protein
LTVTFLSHDEESIVAVGRGTGVDHVVEMIRAAVITEFKDQVGSLVTTPFIPQFSGHFENLGLLGADLMAAHSSQFGSDHCNAKR